MSGIALDARLSEIAALAGPCERVVDVGCDHGRLGAYMLQRGLCQSVVLTDISEPSLSKARRLMDNLDLTGRASFCVADGIPEVEGEVSTYVIAGMGGTTIAGILERGQARLRGARLVLQPNVAAPELRRCLSRIGYAITDERVVRDGRRLYVIIACEPGYSDYSERELLVGPALLRDMPEGLEPYADFRLRVAQKALRGARDAADAAQAAPLEREIAIWEEVRACLRP